MGGGGLSGADELDRPHRDGFKLARNDVLLLEPLDLPSLPVITQHDALYIDNLLDLLKQ